MNEARQDPTLRQHTLRQPISYIGIGLHSGRQVAMTLRPAPADSGILFLRRDAERGLRAIPARWFLVSATDLSTTLTNEHGVSVSTVEHLLAALRGCGVDNAVVELDGPEVPIMDGSAAPFVDTIRRLGTVAQAAPRRVIWIHRAVEVQDGEKLALLAPARHSRITVSIDFDSAHVGTQSFTLDLDRSGFAQDVAPARTFGFRVQLEELWARGKALGGSLRNAILVDDRGVVNADGLRYPDEFVRHKALDCLGDLSLAGAPIIGHFYGHKTGHALNQALLNALFVQPDAWSLLPLDDYVRLWQEPGRSTDGTPGERPHDALRG